MAAKKREIYARCAVQLRGHERAIRAEKICPGAMGLYLFLLLDSRGEMTAGDVAEVVALASWGGGEKYRAKQVAALLAVGLLERRDDRLHVVKYDEHNDTPTDITDARERARQRKQSQRCPASVPCDIDVGHAEVPISISISTSGSDLGSPEGVQGDVGPPPWFGDAIATVQAQTAESLRPADSWLRYSGHRANKGMRPTQQDAVYWLTTVMVPEARKERQEARRQADRDAKFDKTRAGPAPPGEGQKLTQAEQAELAEKFPMRRSKGAA